MRNGLLFLVLLLILVTPRLHGQGFLHRDGPDIVDGSGEHFIIRGIGTGNWLLQEGYMMESAGIAGTQHEFRDRLILEMGVERTDSFYASWLNSYFTETDADSLAAWIQCGTDGPSLQMVYASGGGGAGDGRKHMD